MFAQYYPIRKVQREDAPERALNQDLALSVLGEIMAWDMERSRKEFAWLQLMSRFQYDGYGDFVAGARFIESLAGWLQQFSEQERTAAYDFIKTRLVYFNPAEIHHLIESSYPEYVRPRIVREVAELLGKPNYLVWSDPQALERYRQLLRRCLFFGLSDGARIDVFRRSTAGIISNEQILLATEIAQGKWQQLLEKLKAALDATARFKFLYLMDDFVGTGTTLQGKLKRLWRDLSSAEGSQPSIVSTHFESDWTVVIHLYITTHDMASGGLQEKIDALEKEVTAGGWFPQIELSYQLVLPNWIKSDEENARDFWPLIQKYYNSAIETEHTRKGGVKDVRLGFGQCSLPLIFEHNTPNNSIPLLWADVEPKDGQPRMRPLFRRRQRHTDLV
jgi:hypothetical protein